jgi:hypothetical protein
VRGTIALEYPVPDVRRVRVRAATLEPGYRVPHRRSDARPVELILRRSSSDRRRAGSPAQTRAGSPVVPARAARRFLPLVIPASSLCPLARRRRCHRRSHAPGRERRPVLDNVAQFRFHRPARAAWRRVAVIP